MFELPINGEHVFQPASFSELPQLNEEIREWCDANLTNWTFVANIHTAISFSPRPPLFVMRFEREEDRLFFKMRWVG